MIPESEWQWCGYAGHFIAARGCRFHLHTRIGDYTVSTLGDYYPSDADPDGPPTEVGLGRLYETMVFAVVDDPDNHMGRMDPSALHTDYYNDAVAACDGHRAICLRVAAGELVS